MKITDPVSQGSSEDSPSQLSHCSGNPAHLRVGRWLGSTWGQKLSSGTPSTHSLPVVPENNRCSADRPRALGIKVLGSGAHKAPARGLRPKCVLSCSHHCAGDHGMGLTSASQWVVQGLGWGREVMGSTRLVSDPLSGTHPYAAGSLLSHLHCPHP